MPSGMIGVAESFDVLVSVWRSMLLGTGLLMIAVFVGLMLGRERSLFPVRALAWWVDSVIAPMLAWRSWALRAGAIFTNNVLILVVLVSVGVWPLAVIVGIAVVGVSMGVALCVLAKLPDAFAVPSESQPRLRRRMRLGVLLNMLEPPAIIAALGLALGREPVHLSSGQVWAAFAIWILAPMAIAAGGESLWIGAGRTAHDTAPQGPSHPEHVDQ